MKILRISIVIIYLIVYGYSVFKTTVEPDNVIWGYICTLVFAILAIMGVSYFAKHNEKKEE
jgi:hypothetical protein